MHRPVKWYPRLTAYSCAAHRDVAVLRLETRKYVCKRCISQGQHTEIASITEYHDSRYATIEKQLVLERERVAEYADRERAIIHDCATQKAPLQSQIDRPTQQLQGQAAMMTAKLKATQQLKDTISGLTTKASKLRRIAQQVNKERDVAVLAAEASYLECAMMQRNFDTLLIKQLPIHSAKMHAMIQLILSSP